MRVKNPARITTGMLLFLANCSSVIDASLKETTKFMPSLLTEEAYMVS
jgi:hypothetical protein